jgi:predicted RNase H-like HicB family nuclease
LWQSVPPCPVACLKEKNKEEAPENIKEAIEGILEVRREMNKPVPPPEVRLVEVTA